LSLRDSLPISGEPSSVTSKRRRCHEFSAEATAPAVPGLPCQLSSARWLPGAAGWATHSSFTGTPTTPATAHSTCGHSAAGAEWTYKTPRADTEPPDTNECASPTPSYHEKVAYPPECFCPIVPQRAL